MPQPIKPIHQLEDQAWFSGVEPTLETLSALQMQVMGDTAPVRAASNKYSDHTLQMLESIAQNHEEMVATVREATTGRSEELYRVPMVVSTQELIGLKAQGLVQGQDRVVAITAAGKKALGAKWLARPNKLAEKRAKASFDLNAALSELDAIASGKVVRRIASTGKGRFKQG